VTILASTYISIHPNIPEPFVEPEPSGTSGIWEKTKRRIAYDTKLALRKSSIIFLGIVYPEYIFAWAFRQATLASDMSRECGKLLSILIATTIYAAGYFLSQSIH
jgi:hypothetical protein